MHGITTHKQYHPSTDGNSFVGYHKLPLTTKPPQTVSEVSCKDTKETEKTMKYEYNLWGSRYGGEHTIGTIPQKVADYWLDKGQEAFEEYMWSYDHYEKNEDGTIPLEYQLSEWWEVDDIEHMSTVEFSDANVLYVEDVKTKEIVAEIPMTEDLIGTVFNPLTEGVCGVDTTGKAIVYGQSFEKGGFNFEMLKTDEPFDASKVKFNVTEWDTLKLVNDVDYDGDTLSVEDGDTIGKSFACWIDD